MRQTLVAEHKAAELKKAPGERAGKPPSASEIRTAQRVASERQTRLGLIAEILRGPERDRYDHFLSNGFPVWKGTNYYYDRYRPGLGTAMAGVFVVLGGGFHYLAMYMSWKRQTEFVERYIKFARQTAWGENLGIPGAARASGPATPADSDAGEEEEFQPRNRRERRLQQRGTRREQGKKAAPKKKAASPKSEETQGGPAGARKRVVAENGKVLVVDSLGDVYLEEEDEEGNVDMFLLDVSLVPHEPGAHLSSFLHLFVQPGVADTNVMQPTEIAKPSIKDTAVIRLPAWALRSTLGRLLPFKAEDKAEEHVVVEQAADDATDDSDPPQATPSTGSDAGDFEMVDRSVESIDKAKTTGAQAKSGG